MTFASNVAPKRRVRQKPDAWFCGCITGRPTPPDALVQGVRLRPVQRPGYLARCAECGVSRAARGAAHAALEDRAARAAEIVEAHVA